MTPARQPTHGSGSYAPWASPPGSPSAVPRLPRRGWVPLGWVPLGWVQPGWAPPGWALCSQWVAVSYMLHTCPTEGTNWKVAGLGAVGLVVVQALVPLSPVPLMAVLLHLSHSCLLPAAESASHSLPLQLSQQCSPTCHAADSDQADPLHIPTASTHPHLPPSCGCHL